MTKLMIALLVVAVPALAEDKKPAAAPALEQAAMQMPAPSKEFEALMKKFEGDWKCDSKMPAGSMGPGTPEMTTKTIVKISKEKDMNGMWYRGMYNMPKTKSMPGMNGTFMMGWEPGTKQVLVSSFDSMGGASLGTGTASADTLTYASEGFMMGQKAKLRETMTFTDAKTAFHKIEADMGKGFQPMGEDSCKK